jgi:phosphoadenylyl-sulfate reductase (thioredoxin)
VTHLESAQSTIRSAFEEFGDSLSLLTSFQREGLVIIDLVREIAPQVPVVTIDTGRLPPETFIVIDAIERRYGIQVRPITPDPVEVDSMVNLYGADLFREAVANRMLCCQVRKVRPLASQLGIAAYFTGLRREQNAERADLEAFDRTGSPVRISPLVDWTSEEVMTYTRDHGLPEHPLYARGYTSIGCGPCTRAVSAGESERAGRWWWEGDAAKECGLHFSPDGRAERTVDVLLREILDRSVPA